MTQLEGLLQDVLPSLERFVKFKIHHRQDAEDIIQEVCLTAAGKFDTLKDPAAFKPWILRIAGNKCTDYYRARAKQMQISLDALSESALVAGRMGPTVQNVVRDTLDSLGDKDKQILYLWFFKGYTGEEIAKHLSLPLGTVKSRLHYAKEKFRLQHPYSPNLKGVTNMSKLPKLLPADTIT
ncbi:MAG: RNA polymerase sigma factor, partial [Clostridia bacterium]|nr:RNA polymerase sigma factor [Clostridia bacterium]